MTRKAIVTWGILIALLVSVFGSVSAQSGPTPTVTPAPTEPPAGARFYSHPVVQILDAYFGRDAEDETETPDPSATPDPSVTPDPSATPEPSESGLTPVGEEIAQYHAEGMGFGVLVKIYAMAEAAQEAYDLAAEEAAENGTEAETCTAVTPAELVDQFQSGTGMGQLFKEYGKPALLGVGHVKKALREQQQEEEETTIGEETPEAGDETLDEGKVKDQQDKEKGPKDKAPKEKQNNGKGPKK